MAEIITVPYVRITPEHDANKGKNDTLLRVEDMPIYFIYGSTTPPPPGGALQDKTRQDNALFGVLYSPMYIDFIRII